MQYSTSHPERTLYKGTFKNSEEHGSGKMQYKDGSQYIGEWKHGLRFGTGTMTSSSQHIMRYEGMWANDTYNGKAIANFNNGDWYEGAFSDGWMHGVGMYHYKNGTLVHGEWKMGRRQRKITLTVDDTKLVLEGGKDKVEVGEARIRGKMHTYFLPVNRPCIDLKIVERECVTPGKETEEI